MTAPTRAGVLGGAQAPSERRSIPDAGAESDTALAKQTPLDDATIEERLLLQSTQLVEEVHREVLRELEMESKRQDRLDLKATTMLGATGLAITVALGFAAAALSAPDSTWKASPALPWAKVILGFAVLSGTIAGAAAAGAMARRNYKAMNERSVLDRKVLRDADIVGKHEQSGVAHYRRHLLAQHFKILRAQRAANDAKVGYLTTSQWLFVLFATLLLVLTVVLVGT